MAYPIEYMNKQNSSISDFRHDASKVCIELMFIWSFQQDMKK